MAQKELAKYVAEQLAPLGDIRYIPMMGGWLFYYRDKLIGGRLWSTALPCAGKIRLHPGGSCRTAGKRCGNIRRLHCCHARILEDREKLCEMVAAMYPELPEPKEKEEEKGWHLITKRSTRSFIFLRRRRSLYRSRR